FLSLTLPAATAIWGGRRAAAFTVWAGGVAFVAEWSSTRTGFPFGLYHYTGVTAGRELYLSNVPVFDSLSFTFLAYASLGLARLLLGIADRPLPIGGGASPRLAGVTGLPLMWPRPGVPSPPGRGRPGCPRAGFSSSPPPFA